MTPRHSWRRLTDRTDECRHCGLMRILVKGRGWAAGATKFQYWAIGRERMQDLMPVCNPRKEG
jgi:hypothetical protein